MWILNLSYCNNYGSFDRHKFQIFKEKEKAKIAVTKVFEKFKEEAEEMIKLYNEKQIISDVYEKFDECEIENILSDDTISQEEKIKYLTKECYCCACILPIELNMDSDIIIEHSFPPYY